jgi:hypothetical protein
MREYFTELQAMESLTPKSYPDPTDRGDGNVWGSSSL